MSTTTKNDAAIFSQDVYHKISEEFGKINRTNQPSLRFVDIEDVWLSVCPVDKKELVQSEVKFLADNFDFNNNGHIDKDEFKHYMLLKEKDSTRVKMLSDFIKKRGKIDPNFFQKMLGEYEKFDKDENGKISGADLNKILKNLLGKTFKEMEFGPSISYNQFCFYALGRKKEPVKLLRYNIITKAVKFLSPLLFGKNLKAIWHTSIVAFDFEWWYGGCLFKSRPFSTPFGTPDSIEVLGYTFKTFEETAKTIKRKLKTKYDDKYHVLTNNCNHFSNDLAKFLMGKEIPQEILDMPKELSSTGFVRLLLPFLNSWLGGFQEEDGGQGSSEKEAVKIGNVLVSKKIKKEIKFSRDEMVKVYDVADELEDQKIERIGKIIGISSPPFYFCCAPFLEDEENFEVEVFVGGDFKIWKNVKKIRLEKIYVSEISEEEALFIALNETNGKNGREHDGVGVGERQGRGQGQGEGEEEKNHKNEIKNRLLEIEKKKKEKEKLKKSLKIYKAVAFSDSENEMEIGEKGGKLVKLTKNVTRGRN